MKGKLLSALIAVLLLAIFFSGCTEESNNNEKIGNSHVDNIIIFNNCSGDLGGFFNFEVYEDSSMIDSVYNVSHDITIKEGETETYEIAVPDGIDNSFSYFYFEITCKDNSTTYSRNGPWVNSETYEIYETGDGIHWKFVDFDM